MSIYAHVHFVYVNVHVHVHVCMSMYFPIHLCMSMYVYIGTCVWITGAVISDDHSTYHTYIYTPYTYMHACMHTADGGGDQRRPQHASFSDGVHGIRIFI